MEVTLEVRNRLVQALCLMMALVWMMVPSLQAGTQFGTVYTRAPVLNPATGAQIWSEYDPETGEILRDIADAVDEYDPTQVTVISGAQYRGYIDHYETLRETFRDPDATEDPNLIYTRAAYELAEFRTLDDEAIVKPTLSSATTHVAVRPQSVRYLNNPDELILAEYPVDPEYPLFASVFSLLVDNLGAPLHTSSNRIGIKAAFLSDASGNVIAPDEYNQRGYDDKVHGPVPYVQVEGPMNSRTGSDEDGSFRLAWYDLPCPLVSYMIDGWSVAKFQSRRFNPKLNASPAPYFLIKPYTVSCLPQTQIVPFLGPYPIGPGEHSVSPMRTDFVVDTVALSGTGHMARLDGSMIAAEETTRYSHQELAAERELSDYYDFDGDDTTEQVVEGYWREETGADGEVTRVFETENLEGVDESLLLQGVYLSSGSAVPGQDAPDFTRALDWQSNFQHEGMVDAIGVEDLKNTDMYVFRLADGKLISERLGLSDQEGNWNEELGVDQEGSSFFYHNYLRGYSGDVGRLTQGRIANMNNFSEWQATSGINPELHERKSDHLKPGDRVELLAINRATGYIGSTRTTMQSPGDGGYLSWDIEPIQMQPPELKIWVERDYDIQAGLEKGEIRQDQIIGYEGAALSSDRAVVVYTDWRKPDGTGLPLTENGDEADYGYTGRIAYLSGDKEIAPAGSYGIAQFSIKPGKHMQVLRLPSGPAANQHLYIQVSGEPESGRPVFTNFNQSKTADFSSTGVHTGKLEPRPDRFVPFKVPVFDEKTTEAQRQIYRRLKEENPDQEYTKPKPVYKWVYRPDFQYSIYGLDVKELASYEEEGGEGSDLLANDNPVIASSDDLVSLLYNLNIQEYVPLDYFNSGEEKELIFALGEQEVKATLNEESELVFDNIDHLASLDPEDYLSLRLYTNNDGGNILWEYAFEHLVLGTQFAEYDPSTGDTLYISADDPRVPLEAILVGYAGRQDKEPVRVQWEADGGATLETAISVDDQYGIFINELTLPPVRGTVSNVSVQLLDSASGPATLPPIEVKAGEPASIEASAADLTVSAAGVDQATVSITVFDKNGNPVEANTGVGFFVEGSLHVVEFSGATDEDGKATLTVKGGDVAEAANVRITAGDAAANVPVTVKPLTVEFLGLDSTLFAGTSDPFTLRITDYLGRPVSDARVTLGSSYGFLSQTEVVTDSQGETSASITAPGSKGSGQLTAQVGRSAWHKAAFEVVYPQLELRDLEVNNAMMVGDTATPGTLNHTRYDTSLISLPYKVSENIRALGEPGDSVTVTIGDFRDPNRAPLAAYYMNQLDSGQVLDETGRNHLTAESVWQASGTPMGGGRSLRFQPEDPDVEGDITSVLWAESVPGLTRESSLGFSLDLKPFSAGGSLVNLSNGAQSLRQTSSGSLVYEVRTSDGTYQVESDPLPNHQWHRIAARYHNGQIELWVNGMTHSESATGTLVFNSVATRQLEVGNGFEGQLNSLKWFDWTSAPVMTFDDGSVTRTVTVGPDGYTEMTLQSTGLMGADGSELMTQRIAVHTDQVRQYASLVSREAFAILAGQYADTLDDSVPPINVAGLDPNYQPLSLPFVSQAYAADGESSFLFSLVNWILPIEDFGIVFQQLGYLVSDPEKFDGMEFTIALVNTITIFPPAKPLKLFTTPLRAMFRSLDKVNPKFAKHFGGYLGKVVQRAKRGDFDTLWNTLPFLVLAAELYTDEDAREGLKFLFRTVDSADDVLSWVNYLALPTDGWNGDGAPPRVDAFSEDPVAHNTPPLSWMFEPAYAAPTATVIRRISSEALGNTLKHVAKNITKKEAKDLPDALNLMREGFKGTVIREIRRYAHSDEMLGLSAGLLRKAGARSLQNFVRGKTNLRYHPAAITSILAYLMYESACGQVLDEEAEAQNPTPAPGEVTEPPQSQTMECDGKGFNSNIRRQVYGKIATAFIDAADGKAKEEIPGKTFFGSAHGALFHLEQLAYHQGLARAGLGKPVKEVEGYRYVALFDDEEDIPSASAPQVNLENELIRRIRYVDIVLDEGENKERWIELKSYKAKSETNRTKFDLGEIGKWELANEGRDAKGAKNTYPSMHRQFVLDRVAKKTGIAWLAKNRSPRNQIDAPVNVLDFQWRFHKFKVEKRNPSFKAISPVLGSGNDKDSIVGKLTAMPGEGSFDQDVIDVSVGSQNVESKIVNSGIAATIKTVLPSLGFNLLEEATEEFILD